MNETTTKPDAASAAEMRDPEGPGELTEERAGELGAGEFTDEEIEAFDRDTHLADDEAADPAMYPRLTNLSAGLMFQATLRVADPPPVEYITLPVGRAMSDRTAVAIAQWNMMWEAGPYRRRRFDQDDLPEPMGSIADRGDRNIVFVPRSPTRYHEYAPLFHLLPRDTVERFGLPLLRGGQWPFLAEFGGLDRFLPDDFADRLARAWTSRIWRDLWPQSPVSAFSTADPIRVLTHHLDFWVPPVTTVIQQVLGEFPTVDKGVIEHPATLVDGSTLPGAVVGNPRMGGELWTGEEDAAEIVEMVLDEADAGGRLRGVLDAVRSHRVEDDFSDRWSRTREDFERKLHHKRSKVSVRFVELTDTEVVQSPETQVVDDLVCGDFLALLDPIDRQVVVLLRSGMTSLTDVATTLGYANHSAISKRLARIRRAAETFFDQT